ncbi:phosphomannomutase/phosphoglucomutase [Pseudomarimonas salicorniae]|uniref:phosphomannomutase n=1 Tax=Pseudomarimonas salicorniae TaxID=2933270 RepID=A0ABT0GDD2_9GAMM|nr:phosphomannomutase/phosphoglucomutase [Lysobacter sp. CAU 1642]MCK7592538.1 phosphomannomutase/phosphoglucomutase [Lysobacter sp. CAU 1642]
MAKARAAKAARDDAPRLSLKNLPIGESGLRIILLVIAGAIGIAAAGYVAIGLNGLRAEPIGVNLVDERAALATRLAGILRKAGDELEQRSNDRYFLADVAAGEFEEAAQRLGSGWDKVVGTSVEAARVEATVASAGDDADYTRLALVAAASVSGEIESAPLGSRGSLHVGIARRIDQDGRPIAVAVAELPMSVLTDHIRSLSIGGALIELKVGQEILFTYGNEALRPTATPLAVPDSPFALNLAMPKSMTGTSPLASVGIGAALAVLAVMVAGFARRVTLETPDFGVPTFAETLAAEAAEAAAQKAESAPRPAAKKEEAAKSSLRVDRSIFRAYDIRGVVGKSLDTGIAKLIGQAIGSTLREQGLREIVVGRDGRLSGPDLSKALIEGLRSTGCDVVDIGLAPTPVVYFASYQLGTGSCVAVTGSHNPPDYNGFKIVLGGETLSGDAITALYERISENRLHSDQPGGLQEQAMGRDYVDRISSDVQLERRMKVVVDCGNGVAGAVAPEVLEAIGAAADGLYCEVDGEFPNHHPDPSDPHNLADLITSVKRTGAELGLAFDGDGDRLGVVTRSGKIIYPDRVLMLFAQDVLSRNPGAAVIYDVKCTGHLSGQILRHGGSPIMWKTGHSLIKAKMRETAAELAGEMSGHFFFKERWYGFDDGIYAAARLLEILATDDRDPDEIFAELPDSVSTPELKVEMEEGEHYAFMERFREKARFEGAKVFTIDGVRADWSDGWGLVRCSNTTPCLVLRFDGDSEQALARIQETYREQLLAVDPKLKLPF